MPIANVNKFSLEMEIPEINELDEIWSQEILIHGIPWIIKVRKVGQDTEQSILISLHCANKDKSPDWSLWGAASFKLLPFRFVLYPNEHHTDPYVFDASGFSFGATALIKWNDLFNQNKKYAKFKKYNLEVKVTAENPNDPNRSRLNCECVQNSCDFAKFRMKVTNIMNLMAVQTPKFNVCGLPWNIQISKMHSSCLGVMLLLKENSEKNPIKIIMKIKLISSNNDVQPIEKCITKQYQYLKNFKAVDVVSWDEMFKPEKGVVNDNSITLEIELSKPDVNDAPITKRAKLNPENEATQMELDSSIYQA